MSIFQKGQTFAVVSKNYSVERIVYVGKATRETSTCVEVNGVLYNDKSGYRRGKNDCFVSQQIILIESADPAMLANYNARDRFGKAKTRLEHALTRQNFDGLPTETLVQSADQIEALLKVL